MMDKRVATYLSFFVFAKDSCIVQIFFLLSDIVFKEPVFVNTVPNL